MWGRSRLASQGGQLLSAGLEGPPPNTPIHAQATHPHWHTPAGNHACHRWVTVMLRGMPAPNMTSHFSVLTGDQNVMLGPWATGKGDMASLADLPHPTLRLHQNPNPTSLWGCGPGFPHGDPSAQPPPESEGVEAKGSQSPSYPWQTARSGKPRFLPRTLGPHPGWRAGQR